MRFKTLVCVILSALAGTSILAAQEPGARRTSGQALPSTAIYGKLPLTFEANNGQAGTKVNFLTRANGYTAFLTAGGLVLRVRPTATANQTSSQQKAANTTLQFRLLGANKNPVAVGEELQPGKVNYFIGNDPTQWRTAVPTYARVRYKNVYPGIDLIYYGNQRQIEYDFAVAPGADPRQIQFEIQGASRIALDGEGNLVLKTGSGELHFQNPIVYQESNGQHVVVNGGYAMKDATHVGFQISHYDSSKPLVIDPVLLYSSYLGGGGTDQPTGIAVDNAGNVYVTGYTDSTNFPLASAGTLPSNAYHVFVAKLDATGSNLIYADYIGGAGEDYGLALVLDSENEVYVTGSTTSNNFPVVHPFQSQQPGPYSAFLSKISASGSSLLYSTYLGGNTFDQPTGIAIDSLASVYVAGYTMSQNFPVANAYQSTVSANQEGLYGDYGFLTKFTPDGSSLVYSTYLAGNSNVAQDCGTPCWPSPYNVISAIAVDANSNAYVTGTTNTYNFPTTAGVYQPSNTTQQDANIGFVSKFNNAGSLDYSTYFYGSSSDPVGISAIAVDDSGSAYITGAAVSDGSFPVTSTSICNPGTYGFGCSYAFVTKFDSAAATLLYSTFLGPNNYASPQAIALDASNDAYVLAGTTSGTFSTVNGIESYSNGLDVLLVEIDPTASTELLATYVGGSGNDQPAGMVLDNNGNVYVVGSTNSADFPTTPGAFQTVPGGATDAFIAKIGPSSAPSVSLNPNSLQYASLNVGSTSQPQSVLLRNMGSAPLAISSITASGDFAESDNCGTSVSAAGSCSLSISFTPTAGGTRSGSVTISDNASGSPHAINLSGIGIGPGATLNPAALVFSTQLVGTSSTAQAATLTNTGNQTLSVSSIQVTGDFSQVNNCPASLTAAASCTINVTFTPTASGTRNGALIVNDNVLSSPQTVNLTGTGSVPSNPAAALSSTSLAFGNQALTTTSTAQAVTLTNTGNATLTISSIQITGDYLQTNDCPAQLQSSFNCTIKVTFSPKASGARNGTLTVSDTASGSPQTVTLNGTGSDFSLTGSPSSNSVSAGQTATYTVSIASEGGTFSHSVSLSCSGLPAQATCSFSPAVVEPGSNGQSSKLTITTAAATAQATPPTQSHNGSVYAACMNLQGFGLVGIVLAGSRKRSKRWFVFVVLALLVLGMIFMVGCAGGTGIGKLPTSTNYTVTVTGSYGTLQHSVPLTLTIQ